MSDITEIRDRIDHIDSQICDLFKQRMDCALEVAEYKREHGLPVLDKTRERAKLRRVADSMPEDLRDYSQVLFSLLMDLAKSGEVRRLQTDDGLVGQIRSARKSTPDLFPPSAKVACQGVEGAYSQAAADRLFRRPDISYHETWEEVFASVVDGTSRYGVLPVENSTAGTVNKVYDLMMRHDFHIVRTLRLKVDHNLLAKPGTRVGDVRDVYSHAQAIRQCSDFLDGLGDVNVHVVENTAVAAKMVAESDRTDVAALSSRICADLYGLDLLSRSVQNSSSNYTRFACIARDLEIYPGADHTSLMMVVNHEPGSLYKVLARFYALGINLIKLESRPIPDEDFEFMFYFDIDCPVAAPEFETLFSSLDDVCEEYRYLGSYSEIM